MSFPARLLPGGNTGFATVDDRGRLYLPKELREQYGERFRVVRLHDGIKLIPVSGDPLEGLRRVLAPIADRSIGELKRAIGEEAGKEAFDDLH